MSVYYDLEVYIYSYLLSTTFKIPITPEPFAESHSADFDTTNIPGRSEPLLHYSGGPNRALSFSVTLHEDIIRETGHLHTNDFVSYIQGIKSLTYPQYAGTIKEHVCYLKIGNTYAGKVVPLSVDVSWSGVKRNGHYTVAEVSFSFSEINAIAKSALDVARQRWT